MTTLPPRTADLRGKVFGLLTVLEYAGKLGNSRHAWWRVRCSCPLGKEKEVVGYQLAKGGVRSCGCLRVEMGKKNKTHGGCGTPEYDAWHAIIQRTENPNHRAYHRYGGRGIKLSEKFHDFAVFLEHVKLRPSPLHSIDRLDNEKGYERGNLAWRTSKQQQRNRSCNKLITFQDKSLTAGEWGEPLGISDTTIWQRIRTFGWSIEKAVTTPSLRKRKTHPSLSLSGFEEDEVTA